MGVHSLLFSTCISKEQIKDKDDTPHTLVPKRSLLQSFLHLVRGKGGHSTAYGY